MTASTQNNYQQASFLVYLAPLNHGLLRIVLEVLCSTPIANKYFSLKKSVNHKECLICTAFMIKYVCLRDGIIITSKCNLVENQNAIAILTGSS